MSTTTTMLHPPTVKGHVYHISGEEASSSSERITRECLIFGKLLTIIYDSRVTYSFISLDWMDSLQLVVATLSFGLVVTLPFAESMKCNTIYLQCLLTVIDMKLDINLICIPFKHLGMILRMDWKSSHYVLLDCCARMFVIFLYLGVSWFLDTNKFKFSSKSGVQKYAFLNLNNMKPEVKVDKIPVAKYFLKVFPLYVSR